LTPIEKMDSSVPNADITFFPPRTSTLWFLRGRHWSGGQKEFTAKNPAYGVLLNYYLKEAVVPEPEKATKGADKDQPAAGAKKAEAAAKKEGKVKISIYDKDNQLVREMEGPGAAGLNRTSWPLRFDAASEPTDEQKAAMAAGYYDGPQGPLVEPGEYTIKLKAGIKEATQKVEVEEDPRITMSAADRAARHSALAELYAMAKTSAKDRTTIVGLQSGLKAAMDKWKKDAEKKDGAKIPEDVQKQAEALQKKVDEVAKKYQREKQGLGNAGPPFEWRPAPLPDQVEGLMEDIDGFAAAPSVQQTEKIAELKPQVADGSVEVKKLIEQDLRALNKKMNDAGIPHIVPSADGGEKGEDDEDWD
jgi:hypothetical protein